jgi:hypothetical protein
VKRAIVELNGQDFRGVEFVEDEEEDPKKPGVMRPVKLELADWLEQNYLSTWGKEAIYVVYRKVEDAVARAEKKAQTGVEFIAPDESAEDRLRRVVGEVKDLSENLPNKLVDYILDENGLMLKSTAEEVKRAMEAVAQVPRNVVQTTTAEGTPQTPVTDSAGNTYVAVQVPSATPIITPPPQAPPQAAPAQVMPDPEALMRGRQPMNQADTDVPQPFIVSPGQRPNTVPAGPRPPGPPPADQVHPPLHTVGIPGPAVHGSAAIRGAKAAALEEAADASGALATPGTLPSKPTDVPILEKKMAPVDPRGAATVMDPKPKGGINPHFRPRPRGP